MNEAARRRAFLGSVAALSCVASTPLAFAQQTRIYRIGFLMVDRPEGAEAVKGVFVKRLRELGWQEGRNLSIDLRHTQTPSHTDELAKALVLAKPDLLVGISSFPAHSLRDATRTIPIVLAAIADPVGRGLVASLARPGGNITGVSHFAPTGGPTKMFQILKELAPGTRRLAVLFNPLNPLFRTLNLPERIDGVARQLAISARMVEARTVEEVAPALAAAVREGCDSLAVMADPVFATLRAPIVAFAAQHRLPAVYPDRLYVEAGGLVSYATDFVAVFRRGADYVDKILRGAQPADLPIDHPTKFELALNRRTAQALGLTIPKSMLLRADQVIE